MKSTLIAVLAVILLLDLSMSVTRAQTDTPLKLETQLNPNPIVLAQAKSVVVASEQATNVSAQLKVWCKSDGVLQMDFVPRGQY